MLYASDGLLIAEISASLSESACCCMLGLSIHALFSFHSLHLSDLAAKAVG
jgi:hypothetical protein